MKLKWMNEVKPVLALVSQLQTLKFVWRKHLSWQLSSRVFKVYGVNNVKLHPESFRTRLTLVRSFPEHECLIPDRVSSIDRLYLRRARVFSCWGNFWCWGPWVISAVLIIFPLFSHVAYSFLFEMYICFHRSAYWETRLSERVKAKNYSVWKGSFSHGVKDKNRQSQLKEHTNTSV